MLRASVGGPGVGEMAATIGVQSGVRRRMGCGRAGVGLEPATVDKKTAGIDMNAPASYELLVQLLPMTPAHPRKIR